MFENPNSVGNPNSPMLRDQFSRNNDIILSNWNSHKKRNLQSFCGASFRV